MTKKENNMVCSCIDHEGFDYCFVDYSSFDEIKDGEFHHLRCAYIEARKKLADYLELNAWEDK